MTPAEELTLAAERLEALDAAATPAPWEAYVLGSEGYDVREARDFDVTTRHRPTRVARCGYEEWDTDKSNAAFIAAMRGVAAPLAAWLRSGEHFADLWQYLSSDPPTDSPMGAALTLAREVIRATGGTP